MAKIITFYSYKGGVGRTMALTNVAVLLAQWGYRVLMVDWDLEAPGIENYFKDFISIEETIQSNGIADLLYYASEYGINNNKINWKDCVTQIVIPDVQTPLSLIAAGKRDDNYFKRVRQFDLDDFYTQKDGGEFIETLRREWLDSYDFVLLDSRTGITDVGGICTIQFPDIMVALFTATEQSVRGIVDVVQRANNTRHDFDRFNLLVVPIPSRFETLTEYKISQEWLDTFANEFKEIFADWLPPHFPSRKLLEIIKIPYAPYFSFGEKLPVIEQSVDDPTSIGYAYNLLAAILANDLGSIRLLIENRDDYVQMAYRMPVSQLVDGFFEAVRRAEMVTILYGEQLKQVFVSEQYQALAAEVFTEIGDFEKNEALRYFLDREFLNESKNTNLLMSYLVYQNEAELKQLYESYLERLRHTFNSDANLSLTELRHQLDVAHERLFRPLSRHVFMSYASKDSEKAKAIRESLVSRGHSVWQDTTSIKGGDDWIKSITDGIDRAYAIVVIVSKNSSSNRWLNRELSWAISKNKPIIPIRIDNSSLPLELESIQAFDASKDFSKRIAQVADLLPLPSVSETSILDDVRVLELEYLDRVTLTYEIWTDTYVPLEASIEVKSRVARNQTDISFVKTLQLSGTSKQSAVSDYIGYAVDAIQEHKQVILLGEPGSGKSTTLYRLVAELADRAKSDTESPLPILVKLASITESIDLRSAIQDQLGKVSFSNLENEQRVALFLDGIDELSRSSYSRITTELRALVTLFSKQDLVFVITCRVRDYTEELADLSLTRVTLKRITPPQVREFIQHYVSPSERANELFWSIAGAEAESVWKTWESSGASFDQFWNSPEIPRNNPDIFSVTSDLQDKIWRRTRDYSSNLLGLAQNPLLLFMLIQVFTQTGSLPSNRGLMFKLFVDFMLSKHTTSSLAPVNTSRLSNDLAKLAFRMQQNAVSNLERNAAEEIVSHDSVTDAIESGLLSGEEDIRFIHQLFQEYFAATYINNRIMDGTLNPEEIWPRERWWERTNWEESLILAAGLYNDDPSPVVFWLKDAQPEVTAQCIVRSGASEPPEKTLILLQESWLPRLSDEPNSHARAAIGRALAMINKDNRRGINSTSSQLPDILWIEIPGGEFIFGESKYSLATFYISRFPITNWQFQTFVDSSDGYTDPRWWEGFDEGRRISEFSTHFRFGNHPATDINWYQAIAFCRWLSWKLGQEVRLPTEQEWEKAARGIDGREFPYGNEFDPNKCNTKETDLNQPNAVGIFPDGVSSYGVAEMSGNIWEWCVTSYSDDDNHDYRLTEPRVVRGGSWMNEGRNARASFRTAFKPETRGAHIGFRVVVSVPPIT